MTLLLDLNTHDLVVKNHKFDEVVTVANDLEQRLKIKLLFFKEEWFLDTSYGIPYFQEIFVKGVDKDAVDDIFKTAIASERDVISLSKYVSRFDPTFRTFHLDFEVTTTDGFVSRVSITI